MHLIKDSNFIEIAPGGNMINSWLYNRKELLYSPEDKGKFFKGVRICLPFWASPEEILENPDDDLIIKEKLEYGRSTNTFAEFKGNSSNWQSYSGEIEYSLLYELLADNVIKITLIIFRGSGALVNPGFLFFLNCSPAGGHIKIEGKKIDFAFFAKSLLCPVLSEKAISIQMHQLGKFDIKTSDNLFDLDGSDQQLYFSQNTKSSGGYFCVGTMLADPAKKNKVIKKKKIEISTKIKFEPD